MPNLGVDRRMDLWDIMWEGVDWTHLVQDMNQWRALVNMLIKGEEFFDKLSDCYLLKKEESVPWSYLYP